MEFFGILKVLSKGASCLNLGLAFAMDVKIQVVIKAMKFVKLFGWNNIWLESDSQHVVSFLVARSILVPWHLLAKWSICSKFIVSIYFSASYF